MKEGRRKVRREEGRKEERERERRKGGRKEEHIPQGPPECLSSSCCSYTRRWGNAEQTQRLEMWAHITTLRDMWLPSPRQRAEAPSSIPHFLPDSPWDLGRVGLFVKGDPQPSPFPCLVGLVGE